MGIPVLADLTLLLLLQTLTLVLSYPLS